MTILRKAWDHPRFGWVVQAAVVFTLLIQVLLQLLFGKVGLPFIPVLFFVDISVVHIGLGHQAIPPEVIANGMVLGSLYALAVSYTHLTLPTNREV